MKKIKIEIKTALGSVLFEHKSTNNTIKKTVIEAVKTGAYLRGADLTGVYTVKIEVKKAIVITGLYKYVCIPFISKEGDQWLVMGCYTRTLKDWEKDFWNNDKEFPNDKENEDSNLRLLAFETAKKWFKLNK